MKNCRCLQAQENYGPPLDAPDYKSGLFIAYRVIVPVDSNCDDTLEQIKVELWFKAKTYPLLY